MSCRQNGRTWASGALLLLALLVGSLPGCSSSEFPISPSLDPRASRVLPFQSAAFLDGRPCMVYLPPGYPALHTRYPVLYVHDGESAFDTGNRGRESFGFDHTADAMLAAGEIDPLIIVAITSGGKRFDDYVPRFRAGAPDSSGGDAYVRAIVEHLKPRIDRGFATEPSATRTGIAGFSLGGLISVYGGFAHPGTFGIICGFSGSYYWGGFDFFEWILQQGRPEGASLFVDVGLIDDNIYDARQLDRTARHQGFVPGVDYEYREIAEGDHSIPSVRRRIPALLSFFSRRASIMPIVAPIATRPGS